MKSIRKGLTGTVLAAGAILAASAGLSTVNAADDPAAAAAPPAGMHGPWAGHHRFGREGGLFKKLNLTADQQASVKAILTAAKPQMTSLHQQLRANHLKLEQTRPDDPNYGNVVAEVAQSNAALASQRTSQGAELRAQMYAVLTPAQKTQLAALQAQWAASPHPGRWGQHEAPTT